MLNVCKLCVNCVLSEMCKIVTLSTMAILEVTFWNLNAEQILQIPKLLLLLSILMPEEVTSDEVPSKKVEFVVFYRAKNGTDLPLETFADSRTAFEFGHDNFSNPQAWFVVRYTITTKQEVVSESMMGG